MFALNANAHCVIRKTIVVIAVKECGMTKFVVEGKPQPKERPRKGKNGGFYTPKKTKDYETLVGWYARNAYKGNPSEKAIIVELNIFFKLPQRTTEIEGAYCMKKADVDNISKSVLDGLNGIVWLDDKQVVELIVRKYWHTESKIEVEIKEAK